MSKFQRRKSLSKFLGVIDNYDNQKRNALNVTILSIFLAIIIVTFILKIIDGFLLDLGFGIHHERNIHYNYWLDPKIISEALNKDAITGKYTNPSLKSMVTHHPNTLWLFTQFTWITTSLIMIFIIFRLFKYQDKAPRWLRWIMTQRTLALVTMYDLLVAIVFWASMFTSFEEGFITELYGLELLITILVHALIPISILSYSLVYLLRGDDASKLRESFILKGLIYPIIYGLYYIIVSIVWDDPYSITNLHGDFWGNIWKLPLVVFFAWILLNFMLVFHNIVLIKFNKRYIPSKDVEFRQKKNRG